MCEFHDSAASSVATDPITGHKDPVLQFLAGVALNRHRIQTIFPEMPKLTGQDDYQLATKQAQNLFRSKNQLLQTQTILEAERTQTQKLLRDILQNAAQESGLDHHVSSLDERKVKQLQAQAILAVYDTTQSPFALREQPTEKRFKILHDALQIIHQDSKADALLKQRFGQAVSSKFLSAPQKINKNWLSLYERVPEKLRDYKDCAEGVCSASAGNLLGHLGCIIKVAILPTLGASSSLLANPHISYAVMGGGSALGIGAWQYLHHRRGTKPSKAEKWMTYGTSIAGLTGLMAYHSFAHHNHDPMSDKPIPVCGVPSLGSTRAFDDTIWNKAAQKSAITPQINSQNQPKP
jgi:hypothetical protein